MSTNGTEKGNAFARAAEEFLRQPADPDSRANLVEAVTREYHASHRFDIVEARVREKCNSYADGILTEVIDLLNNHRVIAQAQIQGTVPSPRQ